MRSGLPLVMALAAIVWCTAPARAQSAGSGTTQVSASVVVTTIVHSEADGTPTLDIAVFWRGTPGWFTAGDPRAHSAGATSIGLSEGQRGPETHFISVGGRRLDVQFDPAEGRARILGRILSSEDSNVILVDEVDGASGPTIVDTLRVDARFPRGPVEIDTVVRRHPALLPFLRCDTRFPEQPEHSPIEVATWRQMTDATCARLRAF
jgi:hypothetical protein